jgi:hypothetical protein
MRSFLSYLAVWLLGVVVFTIGYIIYLRENDIPVRYKGEIPQEIQMPVYIFGGIFVIILLIFRVFISYLDTDSK